MIKRFKNLLSKGNSLKKINKLMKNPDKVMRNVAVVYIRPQKNEVSYDIFNSFVDKGNIKDLIYFIGAPFIQSEEDLIMEFQFIGQTDFKGELNKPDTNYKEEGVLPGFELPGMNEPGNPIGLIFENGDIYVPKIMKDIPSDEKIYYLSLIRENANLDLKKELNSFEKNSKNK